MAQREEVRLPMTALNRCVCGKNSGTYIISTDQLQVKEEADMLVSSEFEVQYVLYIAVLNVVSQS